MVGLPFDFALCPKWLLSWVILGPDLCVCIQISILKRTTLHIVLGPTLMTSFKLNYPFKDSYSTDNHILRYWGLALQYTHLCKGSNTYALCGETGHCVNVYQSALQRETGPCFFYMASFKPTDMILPIHVGSDKEFKPTTVAPSWSYRGYKPSQHRHVNT